MQITVYIHKPDEPLIEEAKKVAAMKRTSVSAVFMMALEQFLGFERDYETLRLVKKGSVAVGEKD